MINEKLIQFIWQNKLFAFSDLKTIHNENVTIQKIGFLNHYDGPDFSDARIKIGEIDWAGAVEIHIQDVDWLKHGHQNDAKYGAVILHVVWEIMNGDSVPKGIPCLVLKDYVKPELLDTYQQLLNSATQLPCDFGIDKIKPLYKLYALDEMSFYRMRRKSKLSSAYFGDFGGDWLQMLFRLFGIALGKKANKEAMELLTSNLNVKLLLKHSDSLLSVEAMLYGVSGLLELEEERDGYQQELKKEYQFLKAKYSLQEINSGLWNFGKVRASSRPHTSIAILSSVLMVLKSETELENINSDFLSKITLSNYWQKHIKFGKESKSKISISKELIEHLQINVVVPYLGLLGEYYNNESYFEKAHVVLEQSKPEKNSIVSKFIDRGFDITNGFQTQGAIELYNEYCKPKRCLECYIGKQLLGRA